MAVEVLKNPGPFHKLIGTEQEEHYFYRELKDKGCKKSQWNSVAPHVYGVADKAELANTPLQIWRGVQQELKAVHGLEKGNR